jgi:hypothetical protein
MGATYIQGEGIRFSGMPAADLRYAQRHIRKQTGLALDRDQVNGLWTQVGRRSILAEMGVVHFEVCIAMVDALCNNLLGQDWPMNGGDGNEEEGTFFHNFTVAAIAAGYEILERKVA